MTGSAAGAGDALSCDEHSRRTDQRPDCVASEFARDGRTGGVSSSVSASSRWGVPEREDQSAAVPVATMTASVSGAVANRVAERRRALSRLHATIASPRVCRSRRSPIGWGAHRRRQEAEAQRHRLDSKSYRSCRFVTRMPRTGPRLPRPIGEYEAPASGAASPAFVLARAFPVAWRSRCSAHCCRCSSALALLHRTRSRSWRSGARALVRAY